MRTKYRKKRNRLLKTFLLLVVGVLVVVPVAGMGVGNPMWPMEFFRLEEARVLSAIDTTHVRGFSGLPSARLQTVPQAPSQTADAFFAQPLRFPGGARRSDRVSVFVGNTPIDPSNVVVFPAQLTHASGGPTAVGSPQGNLVHRPDPGEVVHPGGDPPQHPDSKFVIRSIDGVGNNPKNPTLGSANIQLLRFVRSDYSDGKSAPAGADRKSAREISNLVSAQSGSIPNKSGVSDMFWQWGQFLDHDIDLTGEHKPEEKLVIQVPKGDRFFDPHSEGDVTIETKRSIYDPRTGRSAHKPREQLNLITAFVDASNVYGSDEERAKALRTNDGTGRLKMTGGEYLPYNTHGLENAGGEGSDLYLAGDVRANEQVGLTAMHTLFVREHNRLAAQIREADHKLSGDEVYEYARKIVGAQMQVITYKEFLPVLLGTHTLRQYRGYNPHIDPGIANEFSTAAYRFGHSMLSDSLLLVDAHGKKSEIALKDAFFKPTQIEQTGVAPLLRGLSAQKAQQIDTKVVDAVRNFLFGPPGSGGLDLASLNIARGRDHGLADYNTARKAYGLRPYRSFAEITPDKDLQKALKHAYHDVNNVDLWVGGLAEKPVRGALVGETFQRILADQFLRLRDGDRFWYQNDPFFKSDPELLHAIDSTRLSDIIRRNTKAGGELQDDVFHVPGRSMWPFRR